MQITESKTVYESDNRCDKISGFYAFVTSKTIISPPKNEAPSYFKPLEFLKRFLSIEWRQTPLVSVFEAEPSWPQD